MQYHITPTNNCMKKIIQSNSTLHNNTNFLYFNLQDWNEFILKYTKFILQNLMINFKIKRQIAIIIMVLKTGLDRPITVLV